MQPQNLRKIVALITPFILIVACLLPLGLAQTDGKDGARLLRGYSDASAKAQIEWEEKMRAIPNPELLREYMKRMSAEPHHLGSAYDKQNAEWMRDQFRSWGLKAELEEFDVLFPTP
ncbi:MAG TPA: hypothetical protein VNO70_13920, partial [Blastocatellia bacterium]|nr:hypothetical protein [Blastocatellia bacterium]